MLEEICVPREKRSRRRRREGGVIISGTFPRFIAFISNWATDAFDTMPWKSRSASLPAYISLRYTNFFNFPTTFKLDHPRSRETSEKLVFHEILRSLIIRPLLSESVSYYFTFKIIINVCWCIRFAVFVMYYVTLEN